jgi:hypothetical protein
LTHLNLACGAKFLSDFKATTNSANGAAWTLLTKTRLLCRIDCGIRASFSSADFNIHLKVKSLK